MEMFDQKNIIQYSAETGTDNFRHSNTKSIVQNNRVKTAEKTLHNAKNLTCSHFCFDCPNNYTEIHLTTTASVTRMMLTVNGRKLRINESNFRMLCALHKYSARPLSREFLLDYVWGSNGKVANNVNVMVSELRSLLANSGLEIATIRGLGYQMIYKTKRGD